MWLAGWNADERKLYNGARLLSACVWTLRSKQQRMVACPLLWKHRWRSLLLWLFWPVCQNNLQAAASMPRGAGFARNSFLPCPTNVSVILNDAIKRRSNWNVLLPWIKCGISLSIVIIVAVKLKCSYAGDLNDQGGSSHSCLSAVAMTMSLQHIRSFAKVYPRNLRHTQRSSARGLSVFVLVCVRTEPKGPYWKFWVRIHVLLHP